MGLSLFSCSPTNNETIVVNAPDNLTGIVISKTSINLEWTDKSNNETGFKIERKTGTGEYETIKILIQNTSAYSDKEITSGNIYYYRVNAFNETINSPYSNEINLSTKGIPELKSSPVNVVNSNFVSGGTIMSDGGANVTSRGIVWSTSQNPTINLTTKTVEGAGSGSFTSNFSLTTQDTYYIRAYATNEVGTAYGDQITISTVLPIINTKEVANIFHTTATSGGNIILYQGTSEVISRGVVWSTSQNPTVDLSTKTIDGQGSGNFTSNISFQKTNQNITFYVRAYATNIIGTGYGPQVSFKNMATGNGVTDIDGNHYNSIIINGQEWMTENLKTTKYCNGDLIPNLTKNTDWGNTNSGAWSNYNNLSTNNNTYGKLYNWFAVSDNRNICPCGWKVPSNNEWKQFTNYLNTTIKYNVGKSLASTILWNKSNNTGTVGNDLTINNLSQFNALPGGERVYTGEFFLNINKRGAWWSSSQDGNDGLSADFYSLEFEGTNIAGDIYAPKGYGFSVRCIKN